MENNNVNAKMCPHCGNKTFITYITKGCVVNIQEDDTYSIVKESTQNPNFGEEMQCMSCKAKINKSELTLGAACKKCGKTVNSSELNDQGFCLACSELELNPELSNATKEDLLRIIASMRKQTSATIEKIDKKVQKAEETVAEIAATEEKNDSDLIPEPQPVESQETEAGPTKRKRRVKKTAQEEPEQIPEPTVEISAVTEEVPVSKNTKGTTEVAETIEEFAQSQEAPFPNVSADFTAMPEPEQAGSFQMFDNSQDDFN